MPDLAAPERPKRPYRIDPVVAHERARIAARVRNSPDGYITSLAAAELTTAQKRRLAALLMPYLAEKPAQPDNNVTTEKTEVVVCPVCHRPVPPKKAPGGVPRIYCSAPCRASAKHSRRQDRTGDHDAA